MSKNDKGKEKLIRICVLGAAYSGKSTLCNRFVNNSFQWIYEPTTEVGIFRKLVNITEDDDHKQYCMIQIEDTFPINHPNLQLDKAEGISKEATEMMEYYDNVLGNKRPEKKKSNEKLLFKETTITGYMYVFDLNNLESFTEVVKVIEYIHTREEKEAGKRKSAEAAKILVGTKKDVTGSTPVIGQNLIDQLKKKYNLMYRAVSSLTNSEVKESFLDIMRGAMDRNTRADAGRDTDSSEKSSGFFSFLGCGDREKDSDRCVVV